MTKALILFVGFIAVRDHWPRLRSDWILRHRRRRIYALLRSGNHQGHL